MPVCATKGEPPKCRAETTPKTNKNQGSMFFNFFKTPTIRQYNHINIYYDPKKEAREERRQRILQEIENQNGNHNMAPRRTLRKGFLTDQRKTKEADMKSQNIRLAMMLTALFAIVYYFCR